LSFLSDLQPVEDFDLKKDAYMQYYGWHIKPDEQKNLVSLSKRETKFYLLSLKNSVFKTERKNYNKKYKDRRIEYPVKVLFKRFY
jgi:hypothetical protein